MPWPAQRNPTICLFQPVTVLDYHGGKCYDLHMVRDGYVKRRKSWERFKDWEVRQKVTRSHQETIKLIGAWVDFFLSKHPKRFQRPTVDGIKRMRQNLSHLSHTE